MLLQSHDLSRVDLEKKITTKYPRNDKIIFVPVNLAAKSTGYNGSVTNFPLNFHLIQHSNILCPQHNSRNVFHKFH